jgi:thiol-disulfide isomerase/thioredoxin
MPRPLPILAILLIAAASACDRGESEEDPWAAGARAPGSAPRTEGFGESDFGGPERQHDERRDGRPGDRSGPDTSGPEDCSDGLDNDSNGKVDCEDPGCARDPVCLGNPGQERIPGPGDEDCDNKVDDDGDGNVDCDDSDCARDPVCLGDPSKQHAPEPELGFEDCDNQVDDDGDGKADCLDSDCAEDPVCSGENCDNKVDDDGDGKVDCDDRDCREDLICVDDPSRDDILGLVDPEKLAAVAKLPEGAQVGMRAPDFRLPLLGRRGKERLSDLRGYVVLLNFWASWCAPCRKEVPALELTWQLYRDKHVIVLGVSIDEKKSDAEDFLGTFPVSYPMLHDREGEDAARKWQVNSVPTLILIDAAGRIRERHQGYSPKLLRKTVITLDELLKE